MAGGVTTEWSEQEADREIRSGRKGEREREKKTEDEGDNHIKRQMSESEGNAEGWRENERGSS